MNDSAVDRQRERSGSDSGSGRGSAPVDGVGALTMTRGGGTGEAEAAQPDSKAVSAIAAGAGKFLRIVLPPVVVGVLALVLLQLVTQGFDVSKLVIPRPVDVGKVLSSPIFLSQLGTAIGQTWSATLIGFALGGGIGVVLGLLMSASRNVRFVVYPYVITFQSLPKIALAPVYVLWLGFGFVMKFSFAAMLAFFPAVLATLAAMIAVPSVRTEMAEAFCASRWQRMWRISLPSAVPGILGGLEVSLAFALIGAIVGEFIAPSGGLGQLLSTYAESINVAAEFAVLVCLMVLGVLQNRVLFGAIRGLVGRMYEA